MTCDSWHAYPSIYALGHAAVADLTSGPVLVQEKIDGSQFSFGLFGDEVRIKSKGQEMPLSHPEKMFGLAAETVKALASMLHDGWTYRAEYLQKPKHNALAYDRVPLQHLIIFDINICHEQYLPYADVVAEGQRLGLETVPLLYAGLVSSADQLRALLDTTSVLGGQKIEGVVIKPLNYDLFGADKKVLMGKFVSEAYKEVHAQAWRKANPAGRDILGQLIDAYKTPARWQKAVMHLRERGELEGSPRDIGKLMAEVQADIRKEETEAIKAHLWKWAESHVMRGAVAGLPDWWKQELLTQQFQEGDACQTKR